MRLPVIPLVVAAVLLVPAAPTTAGPAAWQPPAPSYRLHDAAHGDAMQILPAGENGLVNATDLVRFALAGSRPPDSDDQLGPYANLLWHDRGLTNGQLRKYFVDNSFGIPAGKIARTERPDSHVNVVIYRGPHDIPHIYAASLPAMAYGAGYAAAEDRLFLMDVLRHYGEGDLAGFVGPSCSIEQMDHDQLLAAGYSKAQLNGQLAALPREYGEQGRHVVSMIDAYVAGINRYIAASRTNPSLLPADYAAVDGLPQDWTPADVVATASLIGTEATGGGFELANAGLYSYLTRRFGASAGHRIFAAFKDQNDSAAPTTIHRRFNYENPQHINPMLTALPDHPLRPLTGTPIDTTANCNLSNTPLQRAVGHLLAPRQGDSNALLVSSRLSRDHHPLAVMGPELGYYAPQILMEEDLHAPGYDAAGSAFPGASFVVVIGRGRNFAWSATTASTDQNDIRVERLCTPGGGAVAPQATSYLDDGRCRPMTTRTFTETGIPKLGGLGGPVVIRHVLHFTRDGVVQGWTTVRHRPAAIVDERSTFGHEVDSFVGLLDWGEPKRTHSPATFIRGADPISYSFNWFYVDTKHIAYVVSGRDPIRDPHTNPNLPTWGGGRAPWRGVLPASRHPHQVDPADGYLSSWNNKPAPGFSASDDMYGWGAVHRVQLINRQLRRQLRLHHRQLTRANLVTAVEEAATEDLGGVADAPDLVRYLGRCGSPNDRLAMRLVSRWAKEGARRRTTHPHARQYADAAAIAIWDELYPAVVKSVFGGVFGAGGTTAIDGLPSAFRVLPMEFVLTPNGDGTHHGDGYYVGWEGYLQTALAQFLGQHPRDAFPAAVLDRLRDRGGTCPAGLERVMTQVLDRLSTANGTHRVRNWTADSATVAQHTTMRGYDRIEFQSAGIVGEPDIEWQNRPTYQQVVEFR